MTKPSQEVPGPEPIRQQVCANRSPWSLMKRKELHKRYSNRVCGVNLQAGLNQRLQKRNFSGIIETEKNGFNLEVSLTDWTQSAINATQN